MLRALGQIGTVEVIILNTEKVSRHVIAAPASEFTLAYSLEVSPRRNDGLIGKLRWTLDPRKDYPNGCGVKQEATRRVLQSLGEFDLFVDRVGIDHDAHWAPQMLVAQFGRAAQIDQPVGLGVEELHAHDHRAESLMAKLNADIAKDCGCPK